MSPLCADEKSDQVDQIFAQWNKPDSPGAAISVIKDGAIVYAHGYGMANLDYDMPIKPDSVFHVASMSKEFTAMCIMLLQKDGKLSVDDDVRKYIPELPDYGKTITIRHLLTHTSGIRDQWDLLVLAGWRMEDIITQNDVLDLVSRQKGLNFPPGEEMLYSNSGYTLLAIIVQRVSDKSLREFADEKIFQPLGMTKTHFHDDHSMIVKNRALAYAPKGAGKFKINIPAFDTVGATSLFTTVEDFAKWDQNFYDAKVGGRAVIDQMETPAVLNNGKKLDYGFGLSFFEYKGLRTVGHGGADAGYRSQFVQFPDQHFSVVVLCNTPINPSGLAMKVADVYLAGQFKEKPKPAPVAGGEGESTKLSEEEFKAVAGAYRNPSTDGLWTFIFSNGQLRVAGLGLNLALSPLGKTRFRSLGDAPNFELEFRMNGGKAAGGEMNWENGRKESLEAVAPAAASENLDQYAGVYESEEVGAEYEFVVKEGSLNLKRMKYGTYPLAARFADSFTNGMQTFTFTRDAGGKIDGFTVGTGRVRGVKFKRKS